MSNIKPFFCMAYSSKKCLLEVETVWYQHQCPWDTSALVPNCPDILAPVWCSPRNQRHPPPPPVDEASSQSQVDEPSTRRWLRYVPPPLLRLLTHRL